MMTRFVPVKALLLAALLVAPALADQVVVVADAAAPPVTDGVEDAVWASVPGITTMDPVAKIPLELKALRAGDEIHFLVRFPDADASTTHRSWTWNDQLQEYESGNDREDVLVLKWMIEGEGDDLTLASDLPYTADIWFWKACRTDPLGYADDKIQRLDTVPMEQSRTVTSAGGAVMHLQRSGDKGQPAYRTRIVLENQGQVIPRFTLQDPAGSRADVSAKGVWKDGAWTVELSRKLSTGHPDDVQFTSGGRYLFGVSRYEIAGREPEPGTSQPLYGCGEIGERLTLTFSGQVQ